MEKNNFKNRCEVRMAALGMTQKALGILVGKPQPKINDALAGDTSPAASALRVTIDQILNRRVDEKRIGMLDDLCDVLERDPEREWKLASVSLILPEDMICIVTERGKPVGTWNPVTKVYRAFEEV